MVDEPSVKIKGCTDGIFLGELSTGHIGCCSYTHWHFETKCGGSVLRWPTMP